MPIHPDSAVEAAYHADSLEFEEDDQPPMLTVAHTIQPSIKYTNYHKPLSF